MKNINYELLMTTKTTSARKTPRWSKLCTCALGWDLFLLYTLGCWTLFWPNNTIHVVMVLQNKQINKNNKKTPLPPVTPKKPLHLYWIVSNKCLIQKGEINMLQHRGHFNSAFKNIRVLLNPITTYKNEADLPLMQLLKNSVVPQCTARTNNQLWRRLI